VISHPALPDIDYQVFLLRDVEDFNIVETAAALSINVGIANARLHSARVMLQKQLVPQLLALSLLRVA
jgi:RNA polymerase sigma-70 factor, ECF subfamily